MLVFSEHDSYSPITSSIVLKKRLKLTAYKTTSALILIVGIASKRFAADSKTDDDSYPAIHQDASTDVGPILKKSDVDNDGFIDKKEAHQLRGLTEMFESVDAYKDGKVDPAELSEFLAPSNNKT